MKKEKYRIVPSEEWAMNEAYKDGYEFLAIIQEHTESSYNNNHNGVTHTGTTINISIPNHTGSTYNKILMQLSPAAEVLYGTPRTNQN